MTTKHIWEIYNQDVKNFVRSKINNEALVNDLVQETFIKVHTKLETLVDENKLKSWIFSIARNTVMDHYRKHGSNWAVNTTETVPATNNEEHDEIDCLHGIIKSLPNKYREPLFLADIKGLKQAEVAEQLKLPLPTTKSRIQRARKLIAQGYMECCDFKMNSQGYLIGEVKEKEDCKVCN